MRQRRTVTLVGLLLMMAACTGGGPSATAPPPATSTTAVPQLLPEGPSALQAYRLFGRPEEAEGLPAPLIDPDEIRPVIPPDAIRAVDEPAFLSVEEADHWLEPQEAVVALEVGGDARAYPVRVLMFHEIVNDTVGGLPVAVTYCPLCNSAVSFERRVRGHETTFGTSGSLYHSALVMYDRATETLWTHFDGRAVVGLLVGERLEQVVSPLLAWTDFAAAFPSGAVLEAPGTRIGYGENPYFGYDTTGGGPYARFFDRARADSRVPVEARLVGVAVGGTAKAWLLEDLQEDQAAVTLDQVGDQPVVIFWKAGQASALETGSVAGGRDVGSVGVFVPLLNGRPLTFEVREGRFVDRETGSSWTILGEAVEGPLVGSRLTRLPHLDTFWFAWSSYHPDTELAGS